MKTPVVRRKFSAGREEKFHIQNADERRTPGASAEDEVTDPTAIRLKLPGPPPELVAKELTLPREPAPPVTLPAAHQPVETWNPVEEDKYRLSFFASMLLLLACVAIGMLGGYLLPRGSGETARQGKRSTFQGDVNLLTPSDEEELDVAYAARHADKFAEAEQLFTALGRKHPGWGAMEVEIGRTLLYQKNAGAAHAALKAAAERGMVPAEANFLLGLLGVMQKSYHEAESNFALAVALDPTRSDFYYFWGDCLRDEGKPLEATAKFRSAMLRNQYETAASLYRLKFWLSEIEADRENSDGTAAEIDEALAQPRPPMEALFATAARGLKAGDAQAAASLLHRARELVEPSVYVVIMRDPLFAQERQRPELAALFPSTSPAPGPKAGDAVSSPATSVSEGEHRLAPSAQASASPAKNE